MTQFNIYNTEKKVIVTTRYQGKVIKGIAKCNPEDDFNLDIGTQLAMARCEAKLAKKRFEKNTKDLEEISAQVARLAKQQGNAAKSVTKASQMYSDALSNLIALEEKLN